MEAINKQNRCRLCFCPAVQYINIFQNQLPIPNIADALKQYFYDQVSVSDIYPKVICYHCWGRVEAFQEFTKEVVVRREQYLHQHLTNPIKGYSMPSMPAMPNPVNGYHQDPVCVDPIRFMQSMGIEVKRAESMKLGESRSQHKSTNGQQKGAYGEHSKNLHDFNRKGPVSSYEHTCEFCQQAFQSHAGLKNHILSKHSDDSQKSRPKVQCDICHKWYTNQNNLKQHKLKHVSEPQKCSQCDKISPNRQALLQHILHVHGESNFKCEICNKSLKSRVSLKNHVSMHLNKKSHKCAYCDEAFTWPSNMYKHQKEAHRQEWLADKAKQEEAQKKTSTSVDFFMPSFHNSIN